MISLKLKPSTVNEQTEGEINCFGTYPHYNAHPLALIGEGEYLQDGEVQYLATRGPQLHGGLVSPHQSQTNALSPLHQRHLSTPICKGFSGMVIETYS